MSEASVAFFNATLVPIGLMLIMFSMGLTLTLRDFALVARDPKLVAAGFGTHLFLLPLLGLAIGALFRLPPELALGLFIISICPAGTTSNALTFVGRGNVALAVILTALTSLVTVFTIPLLLSWAVPWFLSSEGREVPSLSVPTTILQLVRITVLPIAAGMLVRRFAPEAAQKMARWLRPTSFVILIAVIGVSVAVSIEMVLERLVAATPAIWTLNVAAMALGLGIGRLMGVSNRDAMTLGIETGVQNVTLALFLTLTVLGSLPLAVTQNIYGVLMILNATLLIRWWRARIAAEAPEAA
ncbi:bile acid:sodium symporter family protein [Sphingosinicella sp. LHD-64]|uniref:bile acid:sodium symporter family protein n=1 Tax=Sphingosinicella sp. LHD-64 TaxID=3072139 RepID=UPI00280D7BEE|nr:bile acid:sodium symporter family protein [Sphingosinicella sp. LHD-64]MDQ8755942.1 bile acid:sodium symporter family protein [Sphingosinicella sp. LHD-64]